MPSTDGLSLFASPVLPVFRGLLDAGLVLEAGHDGRLRVGPEDRLTDEYDSAIRSHRDALLALARIVDLDTQDRCRIFAQQYVTRPADVWVPRFMYRVGVPYAPHVCHSCGDPLPTSLRWGRCRRCAVAWRLVVSAPLGEPWLVSYDDARISA